MATYLDKSVIAAFQKPAFNPEKPFTAVVKTRYFAGSFDFATKDGARDYLIQQARKGVVAFDSVTDSVRYCGSFVIDRNTYQVWSMADLDIAYPRSNSWRLARNVCLSPAEHAARVDRVKAYLARRKVRAAGKPQTVAVHMLDSDTVRHVPAVKPTDDNFGAFAAFGFPETLVPGPDALPGYRVATCEKGFHHGAEFMAMPDDDPRDFHQYEKDMRAFDTTSARDWQEASAAIPTPSAPETRADGQSGPVSVDYSGLEARIVAKAMADNAEFAEKVLSQYRELQEKVAPRSMEERVNDKMQQLGGALVRKAIYSGFMSGHAAPGDPVSRKELDRIMRPNAKTEFKAWYSAVRKCRREMGEHAAHNSQHDGLGLIYRGKVFMLAEWRGITRKQAKPAARAELFSRFAEIRNTQGKAARRFGLKELRLFRLQRVTATLRLAFDYDRTKGI